MILIICIIGHYKNVHSYLVDDECNVIRHFKNTYINKGEDYTISINKLLNNGTERLAAISLEDGIQTIKTQKLFEEKKKLGLVNTLSDKDIDTLINKIIEEENAKL